MIKEQSENTKYPETTLRISDLEYTNPFLEFLKEKLR